MADNYTYDDELVVQLPNWLDQLRRSEIVLRVRNDPRSTGGTLLGVSRDIVVKEVTSLGQAEFDEPWGNLSPDDRVLLYAYFYQPRHLEELTRAFTILFEQAPPDDAPVVIDLGCGPCTGGLAIAGALGPEPEFHYIGIDRSRAMCDLGERLASRAEQMNEVTRLWSSEISSVVWDSAPGWRPVIVIASYLLASRSLDVEALSSELERLLKKIGRGRVIILYTNSVQDDANRNFPSFSEALRRMNFEEHVSDSGIIKAIRASGDTKRLMLRYALFVRPKQHTLPFGGD